MAGKIDALMMGLGRLAGELPSARRMVGNIADVGPVAPRIAALSEMVQKAGSKAAKAADDWGWKGGKPGEVTAGNLVEVLDKGSYNLPKPELEAFRRSSNAAEALAAKIRNKYGDRVGTLSSYGILKALKFAEDADIPREYTAKAVASLGLNLNNFTQLPYKLSVVSDLMRPMTNEQRETFLQLLPRWSGTLETAASAAKKLYRR